MTRHRKPPCGIIYATQRSDGAIKIGKTTDLFKRIDWLRNKHGEMRFLGAASVPYNVLDAAEGIAHDILASKALGHEWFSCKIVEAIGAVQSGASRAIEGEPVPFAEKERRNANLRTTRKRQRLAMDAWIYEHQERWKIEAADAITGIAPRDFAQRPTPKP